MLATIDVNVSVLGDLIGAILAIVLDILGVRRFSSLFSTTTCMYSHRGNVTGHRRWVVQVPPALDGDDLPADRPVLERVCAGVDRPLPWSARSYCEGVRLRYLAVLLHKSLMFVLF